MGWVFLFLLGGGALALMIFLGLDRRLWSLVGAALMLGASGYALQGHPILPASPPQPAAEAPLADDASIIDLRDRLFGRFTLDGAYLIASDAMRRSGDDRAAADVLLGGIRKLPRSFALWTGLGMALANHDGGQVSPPALLAFRHAMRMAPEHPGPPFFLGVAYARAGDFAATRRYWARAVALSPPGTAYRREIEQRLAVLDQYLALQQMRRP